MSRTIIFDLDGTLLDTSDLISGAINHVRKAHGLDPLEQKYLLENVNLPKENVSEFFYGTKSFTPLQEELFEDYYLSHAIENSKPYEGIEDMLKILSRHFTLAIATNAKEVFAQKLIAHHKIEHFFAFVACADMASSSKPDPKMLFMVKKATKTKSYTLVGDSKKDLMAARSANMDFEMIGWGFSRYEYAIKNVTDLTNKLLDLA